jgi:hypothetical protein
MKRIHISTDIHQALIQHTKMDDRQGHNSILEKKIITQLPFEINVGDQNTCTIAVIFCMG